MSQLIQVIIVDDQRLMRDGLRLLLELEEGIEVIGEASDGKEGVALYLTLRPDVVLMDIRMPNMTGIEATKTILRDDPNAKIIILTTFDADDLIVQGIQAGAKGYMLKDLSGQELGDAIKTVAGGGAQLDPGVTNKLLAQITKGNITERSKQANEELIEPLSERELEILTHIAEGLSNPQIARHLHLAEGTVKNYVSGIFQKMGVRDRAQAAVRAKEMSLI